MRINYLSGHSFLIEVDGKTVSLSYKGIGGYASSHYDERDKALLKQLDEFRDVFAGGISVAFLRAEGNTCIYDVNGAEVVYCKAHVNDLIVEYRKEEKSVNYIAEALIFLRKMHRFITYEDFGRTDAVFGEVDIPKREYAMKHVTPASDRTMAAVQSGYAELYDCILLADLVLKALEARANDVFALPADCINQTDDGDCYIEYTASKNGRLCKKLIPAWLAEKIAVYADDTAELRTELGIDLLFVYEGKRREGSSRQPQVLNADKYNYHIKKFLRKNGIEDIRGKSATQTARQIRAAAGKKRFASGQTPLQVAEALGNSESTAFEHYRELDYREFATLRRDYYKRDMAHLTRPRKPLTQPQSVPNVVDYGYCTKATPCNCVNICSQCPSRITKRGDIQ